MVAIDLNKDVFSLRIILCSSILIIISASHSFASTLGVFEYRFRDLPQVVIEPNETVSSRLQSLLVYSDADKELIWEIARRLEPNDATVFLCDYLETYTKTIDLTTDTWGRVVLCLGMVQTEKARDTLLVLWDKYDKMLAENKLGTELSELIKGPRPLLVIGDSLHFYLREKSVRQWFLDRIKELDILPKSDTYNRGQMSRLTDRQQLIYRLLAWDIIESVDGTVITPERVTAFYPFTQTDVTNITKAAEKAVIWAEQLLLLNAKISQEEWIEIRKSPWEPAYDRVCGVVGKPLGLALWKEYLREDDKDILNRNRVWLICLITFLYSVEDRPDRSWKPSAEEDLFLHDAIEYVNKLPGGFLQTSQFSCLYKMSLFAPNDTDNVYIRRIREMSNTVLDENTRQGIITNANLRLRGEDKILIETK